MLGEALWDTKLYKSLAEKRARFASTNLHQQTIHLGILAQVGKVVGEQKHVRGQ